MKMHEPACYSCPFCNIFLDSEQRSKEILLESEHSICFLGLDGNQDSGPTFLVASKAHYENLYELPSEVLADAFELSRKVSMLIKSNFNVDGITIWQHNEPAGNQDVWHFHIHVKGRLKGDSLYKKTSYRLSELERGKLSSLFQANSNKYRHSDS